MNTVSSRRTRRMEKTALAVDMTAVKSERACKSLNEKLASVLLDCQAKASTLIDNEETDQEENTCEQGQEKPEAEEIFLKKEIDEDSSPELSGNRNLYPDFIHGEDKEWVDRRLADTSKETEEFDLTQMKKRLENLAIENSRLRNSLQVKEKLNEDLHKRKYDVEAEFEALMARLDSTDKENAFLRYEFHVLEKELEIRTEEMEYNLRSADLAAKQHLKSVNRIVELEAECQRLRLLARKKELPGQAIIKSKFKGEVDERRVEMRRRKMKDLALRDEFGRKQEENKNLREIILKQDEWIKELSRDSMRSMELYPIPSSHIGSEDGVSSCRSLVNWMNSEFRDVKIKNLTGRRVNGVSEMSLYMDDFVEMEKLAVVSSETDSRNNESDESFDWLQVVLNAISRQRRISKRTDQGLLADICIALGCMDDKSTKKHIGFSMLETKEEENTRLKEDMKKMASKSDELAIKLGESEKKIESLETELKILKESRAMIEDQMETQKSINEDLDTQLTVTRVKLNDAMQKFSSLEVELEYRNSCCEELEGTCLELQLQLESVVKTEPPKYLMNQDGKHHQNGCWEATAASIKLAECQETIMNLRRQLKSLSSDSSHLHNLLAETNNKKLLTKRCSLRDQMLAEDGEKEALRSCKEKSPNETSLVNSDENNCNALVVYTPRIYSMSKNKDGEHGVAEMAIVPRKRLGFGYLKKLIQWRKRSSKKKCLALVKV